MKNNATLNYAFNYYYVRKLEHSISLQFKFDDETNAVSLILKRLIFLSIIKI